MVVFNYSGREINAKIVYYGPGLSGKTTNLERIYGQVPESRRGKMVSMKTRSDRTLFFDFLPVQGGEIKGFRTRYLLYTVPGQVHYNATRKLVLKGTDAIIFVADSDPALRDANIESMQNLEQNLNDYQLSLDKIPVIIQYNKRDVPNPLTVEELNADLNPRGWPWFEAVAVEDKGVWETFRAAVDSLFKTLEANLGGGDSEEAEEEKEEQPKKAASIPAADSNLVPPPAEPASFPSAKPAATEREAPPSESIKPAAASSDSGYNVDSSIRGDDPVVKLSQNDELWGSASPGEAPAAPAPTGHNNLDLPREGRTSSTDIDWKEEYVPPGSRLKNGGAQRSSDQVAPAAHEARPAPAAPAPSPALALSQPVAVAEPPAAPGAPVEEAPIQAAAPAAPVTPPAAASTPSVAPSTAVVKATAADGGVIRVPVEVHSGSGVVRIEIALQLEIKQADSAVPVDSGATWK